MSEVKPIEELFQELIELHNDEQRRDFLNRACGDDAGLRQQLEGLAHSHDQAGNFLQDDVLDETCDLGWKPVARSQTVDGGIEWFVASQSPVSGDYY